MFRQYHIRRVLKLGLLLVLQFLFLTVILTPIRIIAVMDIAEEIPSADDPHETENTTVTTLTYVMPTDITDIKIDIADISKHEGNVERKLKILDKYVPLMLEMYNKGLISNPPLPLANMTPSSVCELFKAEATIRRQTILNVFQEQQPQNISEGITLATQGTLARMSALIHIAQNWPGPMQVVLHLDKEDIFNLSNIIKNEKFQTHLLERNNIIFNFVIKIGNFYPINYLRNIGLNNTKTKWIYLTDIDFVPNNELYHDSQTFLETKDPESEKKVYVVPSFSARINNISYFPNDKEQLKELWLNKHEIEETQKGHAGQKNTNYKLWKTANVPYSVKWKTDYEPYIIGPTKALPKYNEYFLQRVLDKCSQIMETSAKGFSFWVLPNSFAVHILHERKPGQEYHAGCAHNYYHKHFKIWVKNTYNKKKPDKKVKTS